MSYTLNWTDEIKVPLVIAPTERNETATSLVIFGKGAPNYGEGLQENLLRLLENFAAPVAPTSATTGQLWFDTIKKQLKVFDGTSFIDQGVSTTQPVDPAAGSTWFDTGTGTLSVFDGASWDTLASISDVAAAAAASNAVNTALTAHKNDAGVHLTIAQNTLLDGLASTLTATEINYLDGVTSSVQTQINTINSKITGTLPAVNPTGTPKDGDIRVTGTAVAPIIEMYALSAWRKIFPAVYA